MALIGMTAALRAITGRSARSDATTITMPSTAIPMMVAIDSAPRTLQLGFAFTGPPPIMGVSRTPAVESAGPRR